MHTEPLQRMFDWSIIETHSTHAVARMLSAGFVGSRGQTSRELCGRRELSRCVVGAAANQPLTVTRSLVGRETEQRAQSHNQRLRAFATVVRTKTTSSSRLGHSGGTAKHTTLPQLPFLQNQREFGIGMKQREAHLGVCVIGFAQDVATFWKNVTLFLLNSFP